MFDALPPPAIIEPAAPVAPAPLGYGRTESGLLIPHKAFGVIPALTPGLWIAAAGGAGGSAFKAIKAADFARTVAEFGNVAAGSTASASYTPTVGTTLLLWVAAIRQSNAPGLPTVTDSAGPNDWGAPITYQAGPPTGDGYATGAFLYKRIVQAGEPARQTTINSSAFTLQYTTCGIYTLAAGVQIDSVSSTWDANSDPTVQFDDGANFLCFLVSSANPAITLPANQPAAAFVPYYNAYSSAIGIKLDLWRVGPGYDRTGTLAQQGDAAGPTATPQPVRKTPSQIVTAGTRGAPAIIVGLSRGSAARSQATKTLTKVGDIKGYIASAAAATPWALPNVPLGTPKTDRTLIIGLYGYYGAARAQTQPASLTIAGNDYPLNMHALYAATFELNALYYLHLPETITAATGTLNVSFNGAAYGAWGVVVLQLDGCTLLNATVGFWSGAEANGASYSQYAGMPVPDDAVAVDLMSRGSSAALNAVTSLVTSTPAVPPRNWQWLSAMTSDRPPNTGGTGVAPDTYSARMEVGFLDNQSQPALGGASVTRTWNWTGATYVRASSAVFQ